MRDAMDKPDIASALLGYEVLNAPFEQTINPRRICLYWDDRTTKKKAQSGDTVREWDNRYRYGAEEVGDGVGETRQFPLYIRVPNNTKPEAVQTLLDQVRQTYPAAFAHDPDFDSIMLDSHGAPGGLLKDGDNKGTISIFKNNPIAKAKYELDILDDSHAVIASACEELWALNRGDIDYILQQARTHNTAIQLSSTGQATNWGVDANTGNPGRMRTCDGKYAMVTGDQAGPGGNAFLFCPSNYTLPDGRVLKDGGIVRVLRPGDSITWNADGYCYAELFNFAIMQAWQEGGSQILDLTAKAPNVIVTYTESEQANLLKQAPILTGIEVLKGW